MVRIKADVHQNNAGKKKLKQVKIQPWEPTMSKIGSVDSQNIETIALPACRSPIEESLSDSILQDTNLPKMKHMCKNKMGFVAINGTQSCEEPEHETDIESKQVCLYSARSICVYLRKFYYVFMNDLT